MTIKTSNTLGGHIDRLFHLGYEVIPVLPITADRKGAGKRPALKNWQDVEITKDLVSSWKKKYANYNIGIRTSKTPAIDIDCLDADGSAYMVAKVEELIGNGPVRVGKAPKTLILCCADKPFTKVKSRSWIDEGGNTNAVEILGDGQQFVAYGKHPVTQKDYEWIHGVDETPESYYPDFDLPILSLRQARELVDTFDLYAKDRGWSPVPNIYGSRGDVVGKKDTTSFSDMEDDEDDDFIADDIRDTWQGTKKEFKKMLMQYPVAESYDEWVKVIAAIKDCEPNEDDFKEIARAWSATASSFTDEGFEDKWENGNFRRVTNAFTFHSIEKEVKENDLAAEMEFEIMSMFNKSEDIREWMNAAERFRNCLIFGTVRDMVEQVAIGAYKRITGKPITKKIIKQELGANFEEMDMPEWVQPWVYDATNAVFINSKSMSVRSKQAFNQEFRHQCQIYGMEPDLFVSTICRIPVVDGLMYYPAKHGEMMNASRTVLDGDKPEYFSYNGRFYLNSFLPKTMTKPVAPKSKADKKAIAAMLHFFEEQYTCAEDKQYVMDWIGALLKAPEHRRKYGLLIQAGEGTGKTILKEFLKALLGDVNVQTVSNEVLHRPFTGWQHGSMVKVLEEISVPGHRLDVLNKLKEPITNSTLEIEPKGEKSFNAVNTTSYLAFTNDPAALPISDGSRRWLIVAGRFQTKNEVLDFLQEDPAYFSNFDKAFRNHAPALLWWWKNEYQFSDDFDEDAVYAPTGTSAYEDMIEMAKDELSEEIEMVMCSGHEGVTDQAVHVNALKMALGGRISLTAIRRKLSAMGFCYKYGKSKAPSQVVIDGNRARVWVKNKSDLFNAMLKDGSMLPGFIISRHFHVEFEKSQQEIDDEL